MIVVQDVLYRKVLFKAIKWEIKKFIYADPHVSLVHSCMILIYYVLIYLTVL